MTYQTLFNIELEEGPPSFFSDLDVIHADTQFKLIAPRYRAISSQIFRGDLQTCRSNFYILGGITDAMYHYSPTYINEESIDVDLFYCGNECDANFKQFMKVNKHLLLEGVTEPRTYGGNTFKCWTFFDEENIIKKFQLILLLRPNTISALSGQPNPFEDYEVEYDSRTTIRELLENFDYEHVKPHYDVATNKLYITRRQKMLIHKKKLMKTEYGKKYNSEYRLSKWKDRGYTPLYS